MIKVGIVGATGYTGAELLRLLLGHSHVEVVAITSRTAAGQRVDDLFSNLRGRINLLFTNPAAETLNTCDVVFFATPNGIAMQSVPALLEAGVKIIDLGADFRLRNADIWHQWYGCEHACPELLPEAVYGLPELNRSAIRTARLVANPGCYPTAVVLGFLPLIEARIIQTGHLIVDAKSGVSGAGRKAQTSTLLCEAGENLKAYGVDAHRHWPEIRQALIQIANEDVELVFVPHLVPMIRGVFATLYARLRADAVDLQQIFERRYASEPFVDVLPAGSHPETRSVRGGNQCRIAVHRPSDGDTAVVLAVIDNLVKGAAGQAIQNMNLMVGVDETSGLSGLALLP
jgi:N-acetyl-gamma-glutamyl-phosphate reductase